MPMLKTLFKHSVTAVNTLSTTLEKIPFNKTRWQDQQNKTQAYVSSIKKRFNLSAKTAQTPYSVAEAKAAHHQKIAFSALGLSGLSHITTPVIGYISLPFLLYNYAYLFRTLYKKYHRKNKLSVIVFDVLVISFALFAGFWFTSAFLFSLLFTAHRLVARTERAAQADFSRIFGELSDTVWCLQQGAEVEIPLADVQIDDIIIVRAGEMIPVDGYIIIGAGLVDQHLLTGESQPVEKKAQDPVLTSTLLLSGSLQIQVKKTGSDTITGQIAETLEHAATFKHHAQSRGDRIVEKGASRTMLASAIALPFIGLTHAVAISYSGFGYQMRTAAPLMVLNYLRIASRDGILIKDGRALDTLQHIDTLVFDKTGTLTEEVPQVNQILAGTGFTEQQVLSYAASAEQHQQHPIALAIGQYATTQAITLSVAQHTEYTIGHGLQVTLQHADNTTDTILIGSERFITTAGIAIPTHITAVQTTAGHKGHSMVYIAKDNGALVGAIELCPTLRPQTKEVIQALQHLGITLYVISGDQEAPTRHLAQSLGIDDYFAEVLPQDKALHVKRLQEAGHTVCFMGDGINDSVALQQADVAISLHGAATIAQDTADIVLMTPNLLHLPYLVTLSRELHQRMNYSEKMNIASGVTCISAVLLLGMGLSGAILLYSFGLLANLSNAMLPLLKYTKK